MMMDKVLPLSMGACRHWLSGAAGAAAMLTGSTGVLAQSAAPAAPLDPKLEARLAAEKEARKQCKTDICKVFAGGKAEAGVVTCEVTKTWIETEIREILLNKIEWPWGHAQCTAKIELDRVMLAKLMSEPETTAKLKKHDLKCTLDRKKAGEGDPYLVKLSITPEVTFKARKATKVVMGWSDIDAPMLAHGAIWSATVVDSAFNIVSGTAVEQINSFIFSKCKDVGVEIAQPK